MDLKVESIFKVIPYRRRSFGKRHMRYPTVRMSGNDALYFKTIVDVENYINESAHYVDEYDFRNDPVHGVYAYVVLEIPLSMEININVMGEYLSMRTYLPDGTLWGKNTYAHIMPHGVDSHTEMQWRAWNSFWGREPSEIRFRPGDIVEILGCPGNDYWGNESVDLAIVAGTPETTAQAAARKKEYLATHDGFDVTEVGLAYHFNCSHDTYEVIPYGEDFIDHAPTICVFDPSLPVSSRRRHRLLQQLKTLKPNNR